MFLLFVTGSVSIAHSGQTSPPDSESLDKETKDTTTYVDIKSKCLRDMLRVVLQDVREISLKEDKLSVSCTTLTYQKQLLT
jgi:hypothetical protein